MLRSRARHEASRSWQSLLGPFNDGCTKNPSTSALCCSPMCLGAFNPIAQRTWLLTRFRLRQTRPFSTLHPSRSRVPIQRSTRHYHPIPNDISSLDSSVEDVQPEDFPSTRRDPNPASTTAAILRLPISKTTAERREQLLNILRGNDSELLLRTAIEAFRDKDLVESLPATTITQVFDSIKFDVWLARLRPLAEFVPPRTIRGASNAGWAVQPVPDIIDHLQLLFQTLFDEWQSSGKPMNLIMYKSILRFAAASGGAHQARAIRSFAKEDNVIFDTEACNLFLKAICWENMYDYYESRQTRVTDKSLSLRGGELRTTMPLPGYKGYTLAIKAEAIDVFEDLIGRGYAADTQTFSLLVLAMGRVGDLKGVEGTLRRVWGLDITGLKNNSEALYLETDIQRDSPLYPTQDLLFTIAHVYGINNALDTALTAVDFISQKYSIPIDIKTWEELARWSLVLSTTRRGRTSHTEKQQNLMRSLSTGYVSPTSFTRLFHLMQNSSYRVLPTFRMYDWLFTIRSRGGHLLKMPEMLRALEAQGALGQWKSRFRDVSGVGVSKNIQIGQQTQLENLERLAYSSMFTKWVRRILSFNWVKHGTKISVWDWYCNIFIPNFIAQWGNVWFLHTHRALNFETSSGGRLNFSRRMEEDNSASFEVFRIQRREYFLVRPHAISLKLPFHERTRAQLREEYHAEKVRAGQNLKSTTAWAWYDKSDIGNWIWSPDGKGIRVLGGRFDGNGRLFLPTTPSVPSPTRARDLRKKSRE